MHYVVALLLLPFLSFLRVAGWAVISGMFLAKMNPMALLYCMYLFNYKCICSLFFLFVFVFVFYFVFCLFFFLLCLAFFIKKFRHTSLAHMNLLAHRCGPLGMFVAGDCICFLRVSKDACAG